MSIRVTFDNLEKYWSAVNGPKAFWELPDCVIDELNIEWDGLETEFCDINLHDLMMRMEFVHNSELSNNNIYIEDSILENGDLDEYVESNLVEIQEELRDRYAHVYGYDKNEKGFWVIYS